MAEIFDFQRFEILQMFEPEHVGLTFSHSRVFTVRHHGTEARMLAQVFVAQLAQLFPVDIVEARMETLREIVVAEQFVVTERQKPMLLEDRHFVQLATAIIRDVCLNNTEQTIALTTDENIRRVRFEIVIRVIVPMSDAFVQRTQMGLRRDFQVDLGERIDDETLPDMRIRVRFVDHHENAARFIDVVEGIDLEIVGILESFVDHQFKVRSSAVENRVLFDIANPVEAHFRAVERETVPVRPNVSGFEVRVVALLLQILTENNRRPRRMAVFEFRVHEEIVGQLYFLQIEVVIDRRIVVQRRIRQSVIFFDDCHEFVAVRGVFRGEINRIDDAN